MRMWLIGGFSALVFAGSAWADCTKCDVRFKSGKLLSVGMGASKALDAAGEPTARMDVTNRLGVKLGELWTYRETGYNKRTVLVQFNSAGTLLRLKQCIGIEAPTCTLDLNGGED